MPIYLLYSWLTSSSQCRYNNPVLSLIAMPTAMPTLMPILFLSVLWALFVLRVCTHVLRRLYNSLVVRALTTDCTLYSLENWIRNKKLDTEWKNYETYYRSARMQVSNKFLNNFVRFKAIWAILNHFEQFWIILNQCEPFWTIVILNLFWPFSTSWYFQNLLWTISSINK